VSGARATAETTLLREFTWRYGAVILGFILLRAVWETVGYVYLRPHHVLGAAVRSAPIPLLAAFTIDFLKTVPVVLLVLLADEIHGHPRAKWVALAAALVAGSCMAKPLLCVVAPQFEHGGCATFFPDSFPLWWNVFLGAMVLLGYYGWRDARRTREALQQAEAVSVRSRRRRLEEELQGLQARVDADLLFDTLERIRLAYERGVEHGDRLMDTLTFYLRAAVPDALGQGSAYAREVALLRAWLELRGMRIGPGLAREVDHALAGVRMPPMVLVPMARALSRDIGAVFEIDATLASGRLRIALSASGPGSQTAGGAAMDRELSERLAGLYGEPPMFGIESHQEGAITATLEIPHERIEGGDRGGRGEPARAVA
jgi:hypothetical protein